MLFATDDHSKCEDWCKKNMDGPHLYESLPYKKPLTDKTMLPILNSVMDRYIKRACDLANLGSSQPNESMHQMVSSKASKAM